MTQLAASSDSPTDSVTGTGFSSADGKILSPRLKPIIYTNSLFPPTSFSNTPFRVRRC